jgi:hypothetical protein
VDADSPQPGPDPVDPALRDRLHQHVAAHGPARRRRRLLARRSLAAALVVVVVGSGVGLAQVAGSATPRRPANAPAASSSTMPLPRHLETTTTLVPGATGVTGPTGTSSTTGATGTSSTTGTTGTTSTTGATTTTVPFTGSTLPADNAPGTVPAGVDLDELSCGAPGFCIATDGKAEVAVTHDDGQTWTVVPLAGVPDALSCGSATGCVVSICCVAAGANANGDELQLTSDGGRTWSTALIPAGNYRVESISCWDSAHCLATMLAAGEIPAEPRVYATSDGGATWTSEAILGIGTTMLDCQSATSCWAADGGVDQSGSGQLSPLQMLHSSDDGAAWSTPGPSLGGTADSILGLSCASSTDCVVAGVGPATTSQAGVAWLTADGGQDWTTSAVSSVTSLVGVSCVNALDCWAIGQAAVSDPATPPAAGVLLGTTDGGAHWYGIETVSPAFTAIQCHGADICVLVGGHNSETLNLPTAAQGGGY